jgi:NitT/TauT family transport system ATP-binding protein
MAEGTPIVALEHVSKVFGSEQQPQTVALGAIDLEIYPGEFISLIGPSGCGKSTLLRIIGDLVPPSTGSVRVNGKSAEQARLDRDYGIVFQTPVLFEWRTVQQNVQLPLEVMKLPRSERTRRARRMLELVELAHVAARVGELMQAVRCSTFNAEPDG